MSGMASQRTSATLNSRGRCHGVEVRTKYPTSCGCWMPQIPTAALQSILGLAFKLPHGRVIHVAWTHGFPTSPTLICPGRLLGDERQRPRAAPNLTPCAHVNGLNQPVCESCLLV